MILIFYFHNKIFLQLKNLFCLLDEKFLLFMVVLSIGLSKTTAESNVYKIVVNTKPMQNNINSQRRLIQS